MDDIERGPLELASEPSPIDLNPYVVERWLSSDHEPGGCFPVLAVASVNPRVGDWAAYIGGIVWRTEAPEAIDQVKRHGTKLPVGVAFALFPGLAALYEYRP